MAPIAASSDVDILNPGASSAVWLVVLSCSFSMRNSSAGEVQASTVPAQNPPRETENGDS